MTSKTSIPISKVITLRKQAEKARRVPEDISDGWSVSPVDPMDLLSVFPCLQLTDGFYLRAYQYREGGNGNGIVYAMPTDKPFPPPDECQKLEDRFLSPPKPDGALNSAKEAVEGDGTPWSYLCASILAREINEFGAMWHGCYWSDCVILGHNPWDKTSKPISSMAGNGQKNEWDIILPVPDDWRPTVIDSKGMIIVQFYLWSGMGSETISLVQDIYSSGDYCFETNKIIMAQGPGGFMY